MSQYASGLGGLDMSFVKPMIETFVAQAVAAADPATLGAALLDDDLPDNTGPSVNVPGIDRSGPATDSYGNADPTPAGGDTGGDTELTTGEDAPMSARTKAALGLLGVSDVTITRPKTAGPDYGKGDPGASGDTGGGDAGGSGGSSGDGSHPEPMTTGEGGSVLVDPGSRNPTAGPDHAPGVPGDSPDGPVGGGTHGPVTGGPAWIRRSPWTPSVAAEP
jgi:hypothetical protein